MNFRVIFAGLGFCLLADASCDVVNDYTSPYEPPVGEGRTVLLEEYTGMRCVNCPAAATETQLLKKTFGNRLIVVSVHAGGFAEPYGIFQPDLRSEAGNAYFLSFGFAGTPVGMVGRSARSGSVALNPSRWAAAVREEMAVASPVGLELETVYDPDSRNYTCRLAVTGLQGLTPAVTLWLVEDGIVTPQVIPGGIDENYTQHNVLRGALNGTWGEGVTPDAAGMWQAVRTYTLPAGYAAERCRIVAFVASASREVLCVTEAPVI